ncbi:MAG: hypothetical protein KGL95_14405 [Patescibacteria group bacterium]|nr:hypothetical protein [Patescibacteria group bacterium]
MNYRAAAHSDGLADLSSRTHKAVIKGAFVSVNDLNALIELANNLKKELHPTPVVDTFDPFLTEAPKQSDVSKLPTVKAPTVEVAKELEPAKKTGFLGR